jgi:hypothetical protein
MGIGQHWWTLICRRGVAKDIVAPQVSLELCKLCSLCTIFFMRIIVTSLNKVIVLGFLIISICVCFCDSRRSKAPVTDGTATTAAEKDQQSKTIGMFAVF